MAEQGIALTGNEVQDNAELQKLIQEEVAKAAAAERAAAVGGGAKLTEAELAAIIGASRGGGVAAPSPLKFNIGGQEYEFKDTAEASERFTQALELARKAGLEEAAKTIPAKPPASPDEYDERKFEELLKNDTRGALSYALKYSDVGQRLAAAESQASQLKMALLGQQFKEVVPGFTPNPKDVQTLTAYVQQMGAPPDNLASWEAAYHLAVAKGQIKPTPKSESGGGASGHTAPPSFGRSAAAPQEPDWLAQARDLSIPQLEALMERVRRGGA